MTGGVLVEWAACLADKRYRDTVRRRATWLGRVAGRHGVWQLGRSTGCRRLASGLGDLGALGSER